MKLLRNNIPNPLKEFHIFLAKIYKLLTILILL